jgi:hypothetical protein
VSARRSRSSGATSTSGAGACACDSASTRATSPPKSRYGRRAVSLSPDLARELWRARKAAGAGDGAFVFPGRGGGRPKRLDDLPGRAGGRRGRGRALDRTARAAPQVRAPLPLGPEREAGAAVARHHSPAFTLATYVHLLADDLPDAGFLDKLALAPAAGAPSPSASPGGRRDDLARSAGRGRVPPLRRAVLDVVSGEHQSRARRGVERGGPPEASSATCRACGQVVELETLVVSSDVWRLS